MLADEDVRADALLMDLGMSSMQVDTRERGFSYVYDAPLDMRMDPTLELSAREVVNEWDERDLARALRDLGEERYAAPDRPRRSCAHARAASIDTTHGAGRRHHRRGPRAGAVRRRPSGQAHLPGDPHRRQRRARTARLGAARSPGACSRIGRPLCRDFLPLLEDRRVKRFLVDRARGCICPPDLPVCVCGARAARRSCSPAASIVAGSAEVAEQPARASARLRAARKLERTPHEPPGATAARRATARRPDGPAPRRVPPPRPAARRPARRAPRAAPPRRGAAGPRSAPARPSPATLARLPRCSTASSAAARGSRSSPSG